MAVDTGLFIKKNESEEAQIEQILEQEPENESVADETFEVRFDGEKKRTVH